MDLIKLKIQKVNVKTLDSQCGLIQQGKKKSLLIHAANNGALECEFGANEGCQPEFQRPRENPGNCNPEPSSHPPCPPGTLVLSWGYTILFTEQRDPAFRPWHCCGDSNKHFFGEVVFSLWTPHVLQGMGQRFNMDFSSLRRADEFACMVLSTLPMLSNPFSLAHTHLKFIWAESLRKLRHGPPFYAQCQAGADSVCSYS